MDGEKKSFEEAIKELEKIVQKLEKGDMSLDESLEFYQKGVSLSAYCSKRLDEAEKKITKLVETSDGELTEVAFDVDDLEA